MADQGRPSHRRQPGEQRENCGDRQGVAILGQAKNGFSLAKQIASDGKKRPWTIGGEVGRITWHRLSRVWFSRQSVHDVSALPRRRRIDGRPDRLWQTGEVFEQLAMKM